jgi:hypothetical protein
MGRISIAILVSGLFIVAPLRAVMSQEMASLRAGESIRLSVASLPNTRIEGKLVWLSSDTIVVSGAPPIKLANIGVLEVKRRTGGSFFRSVAFGTLGGAVVGAVLGLVSGDTHTGDGTLTSVDAAQILSILGGAVGLIGGTVQGACCSSSWQSLPLTPVGRESRDSLSSSRP